MIRKVQSTYNLEPAGSRGVWGLDDYQFLNFLWGSSQLIDHDEPPCSITKPATVERYAPYYLYFAGIQFITTVPQLIVIATFFLQSSLWEK